MYGYKIQSQDIQRNLEKNGETGGGGFNRRCSVNCHLF